MNVSHKNNVMDSGMEVYDYIVNHVSDIDAELPDLILRLAEMDSTGQFLASTARFLASVSQEDFRVHISRLVELAIEKDHERKYIGALLKSLWGDDYMEHAAELREKDNNFRRIYKRIYSSDEF